MGSQTARVTEYLPHSVGTEDREEHADATDGTLGGDAVALRSPYFTRAAHWQWWLALVLAAPAVPIVLLAMFLVRLTSRGPALYRQTRVGLHGKHFQLVKVRTMRVDAEAVSGPVWSTSLKDPRITLVGRFLRWSHIDELPQLWNVLRGEMALVGPRPERPEFTGHLAEAIPGYLDRLAVLPGVTGLAQINLPADDGLESVRKKLELDLEYVRIGSLSLDLRIIACTAARMVGLRSQRVRMWLAVAPAGDLVPENTPSCTNRSCQQNVSPTRLAPEQQGSFAAHVARPDRRLTESDTRSPKAAMPHVSQ